MNDSNSFGSVDFDAQIKTKLDCCINKVFNFLTIEELDTLNHICGMEKAQLLFTLTISILNPQLSAYILTGNRCKFLGIKDSIAWLYNFPHFLSPLCEVAD